MSRKLKDIVLSLKAYLEARRGFKLPGVSDDMELPPPLEIRRRRGEALLVQAFFDFMDKIAVIDAARQLELWDILIARGTYILDLAQRIGLMNHFTSPPPKRPERTAYTVWCIFLDGLSRESDRHLIQIATQGFLRHYFIGLYPKTSQAKPQNPASLRLRVLGKLRKHWGLGAELKESFVTDNDTCVFSIRLKSPGYSWQELTTVTGTRLQPTRIEAYTLLLDEVGQGLHRPDNTAAVRLPYNRRE